MNKILLFLLLITFSSCQDTSPESKTLAEGNQYMPQEQEAGQMTHDSTINNNEISPTGSSVPVGPDHTRLRYPRFSMIIYDFEGYTVREEDGIEYVSIDTTEASLQRIEGTNSEGTILEYLLVRKDTLHLGEQGLENNLIQIKSVLRQDSFAMSYAYLNSVHELFDHLQISWEEKEKLFDIAFRVKGITSFYPMPDSGRYFFRTPTYPPQEDWYTYAEGFMTRKMFAHELQKIKDKYQMRDTLLQYSGEGGSYYAHLTKDGRIFGYHNEAYIFQVKRFRDQKLLETKYIVVYIYEGC
jgi:hypothetical protein